MCPFVMESCGVLEKAAQQPVAEVWRRRELRIFRRIEARKPQAIRESSRFSNEESAEKARSQRGETFATGC